MVPSGRLQGGVGRGRTGGQPSEIQSLFPTNVKEAKNSRLQQAKGQGTADNYLPLEETTLYIAS